jgi:capping protein beta
MEDGGLPSDRIRQLEVLANSAFNMYREMYYEGGISSVYLWELDTDSGFAGVFLIKKSVGAGTDSESSGCWDSINVMEVREKANGRSAHYKLTSTVMLWLQTGSDEVGSLNLGGTMTRQMESDHELLDQVSGHVKNIGSMIEELENKTRSHLNDIYFGRTKDIVNGLRSCVSLEDDQQRRRVHAKLIDNLTNM